MVVTQTSSPRVEVRTWPQMLDVHVIDPPSGITIALFPFDFQSSGVVFDPLAIYEERANDALLRLERDQINLRDFYNLNDVVHLIRDNHMRSALTEVLEEHDLELDQFELCYLRENPYWLVDKGPEPLFEMMCDWIDVAERHYPSGASLSVKTPNHWASRSRPQNACNFHFLAGVNKTKRASSEEAYRLFLQMIDVPLAGFTLGRHIRWIYYHLTEFPDRWNPELLPQALAILNGAAEFSV